MHPQPASCDCQEMLHQDGPVAAAAKPPRVAVAAVATRPSAHPAQRDEAMLNASHLAQASGRRVQGTVSETTTRIVRRLSFIYAVIALLALALVMTAPPPRAVASVAQSDQRGRIHGTAAAGSALPGATANGPGPVPAPTPGPRLAADESETGLLPGTRLAVTSTSVSGNS